MSSKKDPVRQINVKPNITAGQSDVTQQTIIAPPAIGSIPIPTRLRIASPSVIARSAQSPMAYMNIAWDQPPNIKPDYYEIEYGKQSDWNNTTKEFANSLRVKSYVPSAALLADAASAYYVRVRAVFRSSISPWTPVLAVTTASDSTPPPDLDSYAVTFENGNVIATWDYTGINPESFKHTRIRIWNAARSVLYGTYYNATGTFVWYESENFRLSGGVGVTSVSVDFTPMSWSNTEGSTETGAAILPPLNPVTSLVNNFTTGDLDISWVNPTTNQYRFIEIRIYDSAAKTNLYRTVQVSGKTYRWTVEQNFEDRAALGFNTADPSVFVEVQVKGWLNQVSANVSATTTKALPATPSTLTSNWGGDALVGRASADLIVNWSSVPYVKDYQIVLDGNEYVTLFVTDLSLVYTYAQNILTQDTPNGHPQLVISVSARDRLLQVGSSIDLNVINGAPNSADFTVTMAPGFSTIGAIIGQLAEVKDIRGYQWILKTAGTPTVIKQVETTTNSMIFTDLNTGTYDLEVRAIDQFYQLSDPKINTNIYIDTLTLEDLRENVIYTSSGTPTLTDTYKWWLRDGEVTWDTTTYVPYGADPSGWKWIQAERELVDRYRYVSLSGLWNAAWKLYMRISIDNVNFTWFAVTSAPTASLTFVATEQASEAAAQAAAVSLGALVRNNWRIDLGKIYEARYIRIYFGQTSSSFGIKEFYPRRLVQADDIEAETIRALHISSKTITGDQIFGTNLSAIFTETGTLNIATGGHIRSGMTAWTVGTGFWMENNGGTPRFMIGQGPGPTRLFWNGTNLVLEGAGMIIRSANSTTRVELNGTGLYGYNAGVEQIRIQSSDGKMIAGAGALTVDRNGITFNNQDSGTAFAGATITWNWTDGTAAGTLYVGANTTTSGGLLDLVAKKKAGTNSAIAAIRAEGSTAGGSPWSDSAITLVGHNAADGTSYVLISTRRLDINTNNITLRGAIAITDNIDGWLRLNNSSDYTNGVYSPGHMRFDGTWNKQNNIDDYRLQITNSTAGNQFMRFAIVNAAASGYRSMMMEGYYGFGTSSNTPVIGQRIRIYSVDNTSSTYSLAVVNASGSSNIMYLRGDGYPWVNVAWNVGSDERLKKNLVKLNPKTEFDKLMTLELFEYDRTDFNLHEVGVIAQKIMATYPLEVTSAMSAMGEERYSVNYNGLFVRGIAAIQHQAANTAQITLRVTELERLLNIIKTLLPAVR